MERGYYEDLIRVDRFNNQLWEVYMNKPQNWLDVQGIGLEQFRGDFLQKELVASFATQTRFGPIRTNRWGMRDRDYALAPPPNTVRMALLGASTVMGWGVADDQVFETLVEDRLNRELGPTTGLRYEILNFAVPGYEPLQQLLVLDKAWRFSPQTVIHVAAGREMHGAVQNLVTSVRKGVPIPYPFLTDLARRAGFDASTDEATAVRRMEPFRQELVAWVYGEMARACRERGVKPVLLFVPHVNPGIWEQEAGDVLRLAREAGFTVIDLSGAYRGLDGTTLRLAEWDAHPNVRGHQLLADGFYAGLTTNAAAAIARREDRPWTTSQTR
jgi:hypothetical protein